MTGSSYSWNGSVTITLNTREGIDPQLDAPPRFYVVAACEWTRSAAQLDADRENDDRSVIFCPAFRADALQSSEPL